MPDFSLPISLHSPQARAARGWLIASVVALAIAGAFSLMLVLPRTPGVTEITQGLGFNDFFHSALVVHVDLSVLVWFLGIACLLLTIAGERREFPYANKAGLVCFSLGIALIALSFFTDGLPLMSNYVPVIDHLMFFLGLSLIIAGVALAMLTYVYGMNPFVLSSVFIVRDGEFVQRDGILFMALMLLLSMLPFYLSVQVTDRALDRETYFEEVFWNGGHLLQFAWLQLVFTAWLWLAGAMKLKIGLSPRWIAFTILLNFLIFLWGLFGGLTAEDSRYFYTQHMKHGAGVAATIFIVFFGWALLRYGRPAQEVRALWSSLWMSILLFVMGGIIGFCIEGADVTTPAHYHGSIVGVTLALMGLTYALLPALGYQSVAHTKMAFWQPVVLGVGQILHISGLALSGGYGVLRKTPGALEPGMTAAKFYMGIMGAGGLLAIIGGLMFVIVAARSMWKAKG